MSSPIISLTTDFGGGGYVGAVKGVVLDINLEATIVDISHDVPAQDVHHAAFVLGSTYKYFPRGTTHVGVVDPGVVTSRRGILLVTPAGRFVAPDNGLLTYVLQDHGGEPRPSVGVGDFMEPVPRPVPEGWQAYSLSPNPPKDVLVDSP